MLTMLPVCMCLWVQDEVRVLVNGIYFTTGYLGFLTSWILDTIHR